jgi:hypothetical protein
MKLTREPHDGRGLAWITARRVRMRRDIGEQGAAARRDVAVGLALAASWCAVWALYATYTWTAGPGRHTFQAVRFYLPALGAIALLSAWLVVRAALPGQGAAGPEPLRSPGRPGRRLFTGLVAQPPGWVEGRLSAGS